MAYNSDNQRDAYNGNPYVKPDGYQQSFTANEIVEYQKCMADPAYFARTYIKVINLDRGLVPFLLYPYQEEMFKHFNSNRFSIVLACRQSGKSISSIAYLLWYAIFHSEKTIAILANKGATAREMLSRISLAIENLPFFLQPGCKVFNKGTIAFSNNSKIVAAATSASSIRGMSINLLFLDEFAFVENSNEFYTSTYPVITSGTQTKVIITSTANGVGNLFYRLWEGAVQGANDFKGFRVDWWDVPGRDEEWKRQTVANTSELQFSQEFGNSFIGSSNTLISSDALLGLKGREPTYRQRDVNYFFEPKESHHYALVADVSKGRGQDYSTFTIIDVSVMPFEQVATFRDNLISPLLFPDIIVRTAKIYNNAMVIIENNDAGQVVCNAVYHEYEYENTFVESAVKSGGIGVTMTKKVKRIGCSNLKDIIESGKLMIYDVDTIHELSSFESRGGSYQAAGSTHDDMVMNLVLFAWFVSSEAFGDISTIDLKQLLYSERIREMEEDVPLFGIFSADENAMSPEYADIIKAQQEWGTF
jgi:hypothetical protein